MGNIDFTDTRFVDPEYAHLAAPDELGILHLHDGHLAIPVATSGWALPVDEPIAEVVYLAWRLGFEPRSFCQETAWSGQPLACIAFQDMDECQRFVRLAEDHGFDSECFEIGAWVEGGDVIGEADFSLQLVPALVATLRRALAEL